jgi:hypothetical protein
MNGLVRRLGSVRIQVLTLAILLGASGISFAITAEQRANWGQMSGTSEADAQGKVGLQYDVTTSTVVLTLEKGSRDIRATQDVLYNIWGGRKSASFRAMGGNYTIEDYSCSDGEGHEFEGFVDGVDGGGKTLVWFYPEMTSGLQRSLAKFTMKNDLKQEGDRNSISATWASAWRTDVHCLRWTVVMPVGIDPDVKTVMPQIAPAKKVFRNGRWTVTQDIAPLKGNAFQMTYAAREMSGPAPAEGKTVAIAMSEPCFLSGQVVDAATGKPAPGVHMYRLASPPNGGSSDNDEVVSDEKGHFETKVIAGSNVNFSWQPSPDGQYILDGRLDSASLANMMLQRVTKSQSDLVLKVKLRPMVPLKGSVTDPQGQPVAGALLYVTPESGPVATNGEGKFVLPIAPTDHDYDLFVTAPKSKLAAIVRLQGGMSSVAISLEPTRDFAGEVKSEDGLPAPGLKFSLTPTMRNESISDVVQVMVGGQVTTGRTVIYRAASSVTTNADGTFRAEGLYPKGTYQLSWSSDYAQNRAYGVKSTLIDLGAIAESEPIRFQARMYLNALMGRVTNEMNKPLAGAAVGVQAQNSVGPSLDPMRQEDRVKVAAKPIVTDKDGLFAIERLAAGEAVLQVSAAGYQPKSFLVRTDDVDVQAKLEPAGGANARGSKPSEAAAR